MGGFTMIVGWMMPDGSSEAKLIDNMVMQVKRHDERRRKIAKKRSKK